MKLLGLKEVVIFWNDLDHSFVSGTIEKFKPPGILEIQYHDSLDHKNKLMDIQDSQIKHIFSSNKPYPFWNQTWENNCLELSPTD